MMHDLRFSHNLRLSPSISRNSLSGDGKKYEIFRMSVECSMGLVSATTLMPSVVSRQE